MAKAMRVCSKPKCPKLTADGGRCTDCRRDADQQRGTRQDRGYDAAWERTRTAYLAQPGNGACVLRGPRCTGRATVADHYPVSRRQLVTQGVRDPDAWHRLRPLCASCHGVATSQHQPGGWAAR